ncbi:hypothetical protein NliqN6_4258 [Naganishia liquefaciens]|uniref:SDR family NAD(P)-dependent oxidoreductase n=1 Tax=Naganishia liquefaciens TaxID=104408 RepID=A0A8H3TUM1_9TREE|nr:hypothetical protein NliqN6_4258 [Naganishia liquefaciens]
MAAITSVLPANAHALIVGGTAGIGAAIAKRLAFDLGPASTITIAGRNASAAQRIIDAVQSEGPHDGKGAATMNFAAVDCGKVSDVKRFCHDYRSRILDEPKHTLDLLILSPGILAMDGRQPASPGSTLDLKMCLHYYARMLIIRELAPCLSPQAITMSVLDGKNSDALASGIKWDDMELASPHNYGIARAAQHCLAFTDIQLEDFAHVARGRGDRQSYIHAYPGIVSTEIFNTPRLPWYARWGAKGFASVMAVTPDTCARRLIEGMAACKRRDVDDDAATGMWNIDDKGRILENKHRADDELRERVRQHTWHAVDSQAEGA